MAFCCDRHHSHIRHCNVLLDIYFLDIISISLRKLHVDIFKITQTANRISLRTSFAHAGAQNARLFELRQKGTFPSVWLYTKTFYSRLSNILVIFLDIFSLFLWKPHTNIFKIKQTGNKSEVGGGVQYARLRAYRYRQKRTCSSLSLDMMACNFGKSNIMVIFSDILPLALSEQNVNVFKSKQTGNENACVYLHCICRGYRMRGHVNEDKKSHFYRCRSIWWHVILEKQTFW